MSALNIDDLYPGKLFGKSLSTPYQGGSVNDTIHCSPTTMGVYIYLVNEPTLLCSGKLGG